MKIDEFDEVIDSFKSFQEYIDRVWNGVKKLGIDLEGCSSDHIGVRVNWGANGEGDYSKYIEAKKYMQSVEAKLISEAIIPMNESGRPISIFKLKKALKTNGGEVQYVEIPAPRRGRNEVDGVDHIEIVLPYGMNLSIFAERYKDILLRYISEDILMQSLAKEASGGINPDIILDLGNNLRVKFHTKDIGSVVAEEQSGLEILDILAQRFNETNPNVIG